MPLCARQRPSRLPSDARRALPPSSFPSSLDKAPHYGLGLSEERLGIGLKAAGADPRGVRVWSKVGRLVRPLSAIKPGDVLETENMAGEPTCIFPETPRQVRGAAAPTVLEAWTVSHWAGEECEVQSCDFSARR